MTCARLSEATAVADRIQQSLAPPFLIDGHELYVSASIGIAWSATPYNNADEVLHDADLAMYRAKTQGKARYEIYDPKHLRHGVNRLDIETNLRRALKNNEFELHYQPIMALSRNEIVGFEALVRWRKSPTELVYPDEFISIAEDTGLILFLDTWVLREACRTMHRWHQQFPAPATALDQRQPLRPAVHPPRPRPADPQILDETGIDPRTVRLEITESVSMADSEHTVNVLSQLKRSASASASTTSAPASPRSATCIVSPSICSRSIAPSSPAWPRTTTASPSSRPSSASPATSAWRSSPKAPRPQHHVSQLTSLACEYGQGYFFSRPLNADAAHALLETAAAPIPV